MRIRKYRERLDLQPVYLADGDPRWEQARVLDAVADELEAVAEREDSFDFRRAAAKVRGRARDLDGYAKEQVRIPLTSAEAVALSDVMDDNPDASYGGHWRSGRSGMIDWQRGELVTLRGEVGGSLPEALGWFLGPCRGPDVQTAALSTVVAKITEARRKVRAERERG